jgi:ribonuclease P protein subunit POP4
MPTPETLPRHELAGLQVRVADATHDGYVGIAGRVVDETRQTLLVEGSSPATGSGVGVRQVPKAAATFEFRLPADDDAPATTQGADQFVTVAGERLVARPARRTEHRGDSTWR